MKEFNLERALAGEPVVTIQDDKVLELYQFKELTNRSGYNICVILKIAGIGIVWVNEKGQLFDDYSNSLYQLFMASVKKSIWINIYDRGIVHGGFDTKEYADHVHSTEVPHMKRVACLQVEWEE